MELTAKREEELKIQGGIRALNKLLAIALSQAYIVGVVNGEKDGHAVKGLFDALIKPLLAVERQRLNEMKSEGANDR